VYKIGDLKITDEEIADFLGMHVNTFRNVYKKKPSKKPRLEAYIFYAIIDKYEINKDELRIVLNTLATVKAEKKQAIQKQMEEFKELW